MFNQWLDTYLTESNIDLEERFIVQGKIYGDNDMDYQCVIDLIKSTSQTEKNQIKNQIVKIDFNNGDVRHYLRHLAQAVAI